MFGTGPGSAFPNEMASLNNISDGVGLCLGPAGRLEHVPLSFSGEDRARKMARELRENGVDPTRSPFHGFMDWQSLPMYHNKKAPESSSPSQF